MLDNRKDGPLGIFWKFARVGERLSPYVGICCVLMAVSCLPRVFLSFFLSFQRLSAASRGRKWMGCEVRGVGGRLGKKGLQGSFVREISMLIVLLQVSLFVGG